MAGKNGKSQPSNSPSVRPTAAAKAILKARAWLSRAMSASAGEAELTCIGQDRHESYPERANSVHDGIVGRIDNYVCLRTIANAAWDIVVSIGFDLNGEALRIPEEGCGATHFVSARCS